jgi:hypothetical protein
LVEDNKIINNQTEVSEIFNNFFINVAKDIGSSNKPLPSIGNSDHDIVLLDVACKPVKPKPTRRKKILWKKAEVHNIQNV